MAQNENPPQEQHFSNVKHNHNNKKYSTDNHAVTKHLHKELMTLMMSQDKNVSAFSEGENLFKWIVYEDQKYKLSMQFPNSYPYSSPLVKFLIPCFHPNVATGGIICVDILKDKWSALYDGRTISLSIQALLGEPNINIPLNSVVQLWKSQE